MTTLTQSSTSTIGAKLGSIALAAFLGLGIIAIAGHGQAHVLHDAAHDVRHATGFPCH
ncbi:CbtB domain-containing protein [Roseibium sp.]|uniref:CbtB domain-containing protein n=1 Tax=Roseibium sp. TaxID=1936156 RepID=UPI003D13C49A